VGGGTSDGEEVNSYNTFTVKLENSTVKLKAILYTETVTFKDFTCLLNACNSKKCLVLQVYDFFYYLFPRFY